MTQIEHLRLAIMTVDRSPPYVHTTLASLFASGEEIHRIAGIELVVGSKEAQYLRCYRHHAGIRIHELTIQEADRIHKWGTGHKFCHNYHRCLSVPLGEAKGLIICEDDVVVRDHFLAHLLATINEMEEQFSLSRYLLALYVPYRLADVPAFRRGRFFASYNAPMFYGTQCMYYPATVVGELRDWMEHKGVNNHTQPGDFVVKDYGKSINAIYGTVASLAQHIGRTTTGLGKFHRSPTFTHPFPKPGA